MTRVVVACGALALHVNAIARRRGWDVEVRPVPPELHNRPERIRAAVEQAADGDEVVVAYAHCGADLAGFRRFEGADCYEVYGAKHEPGVFFLTDFLVRAFDRVVVRPLGLDRYPELRELAESAAAKLELPLEVRETGEHGLERALERLLREESQC